MLIFVSDMHLTDQTLAPSVPREALDQFTEEVKRLSNKPGIVEVILLGDIFDVLRSSEWLIKISGENHYHTPIDIRPWHSIDDPIERVVSAILTRIKKSYGTSFEEIRRIGNVKISWVPGNHDRLVKITGAGRQFLNDIGVQPTDYEILQRDYHVFARHGHCFDKYNIRDSKYKLAPFGDAVVIEILNKLQIETAKKSGIVNFDHPDIAFLGAVEYVRPHVEVPIWIHERTETLPDVLVRSRTREAWRNVVDSFKKSEMLQLLPVSKRRVFRTLLGASKDFRIPIMKLLGIVERLVEKTDKYKEHASKDSALSDLSVQYVVYGHTHKPGKYQIKNNKYYINMGWWERSYILSGDETKAFMCHFYILIIDKDRGEPEFKQIPINSPITWKPPYRKSISLIVSFKDAQKAEMRSMKEAMFEKGLIDLFTDAPGIKVKALENPRKRGFDMIVQNNIRPATFGRHVAVEIRHKVEIPDINRVAENVRKAQVDRVWVFTLEKVSNATKEKAKDSKVTVFDIADIDSFRTGESFASLLDSYKGLGMKF